MPNFMTGGAEAYKKALRQEYKAARARLQARLKECSDPIEQQAIQSELRDLNETFEAQLRKIRHCLFGNH